MQNLKVVAHLFGGLCTFDDWTPDIAAILENLILQDLKRFERGKNSQKVREMVLAVHRAMPLEKGRLGSKVWYWATSSPCYTYALEYADAFRKRWQPGLDSPPPNWGKTKPTWSGKSGGEKAYDLPNYIRVTNEVTWYCRGDLQGVERVLSLCKGIGKKRSIGHGQVHRWEVCEVEADHHLIGPSGELMRPIPVALLPHIPPVEYANRNWGWRPPAWLPVNKAVCAMPIRTVLKHG